MFSKTWRKEYSSELLDFNHSILKVFLKKTGEGGVISHIPSQKKKTKVPKTNIEPNAGLLCQKDYNGTTRNSNGSKPVPNVENLEVHEMLLY